jgi:integrase
MIAAGVNIKTVSTFMGHANISVTMDLYGHLLPGSEEEALELFDAMLARGVQDDPTSPGTSPDAANAAA